MLCFVTALVEEAQPIIRYFQLRQQSRFRFRYYESDQARLIISGTGKIASATATALLLNSLPDHDAILVINYGSAAAPKNKPIGSLWLINKISDSATGKSVYPDIIWKTDIPEAALMTVDKPIKKVGANPDSLFDMEAAAFYQSANHFVHTHQILIFKTITDHGSADRINHKHLQTLHEKNAPILLKALQKAAHAFLQNIPQRIPIQLEIIENLRRSLRLTETQYHMLKTAVRAYKIRHGRDFHFSIIPNPPQHPQQRNRLFRDLLHELNS